MEIVTAQFLEEHRTYRREEVIGCYQWLNDEFWGLLVELHGLLPLGTDKDQAVSGRNLLAALENHACGTIVQRRRNPIAREQLRKLKKESAHAESVDQPSKKPNRKGR